MINLTRRQIFLDPSSSRYLNGFHATRQFSSFTHARATFPVQSQKRRKRRRRRRRRRGERSCGHPRRHRKSRVLKKHPMGVCGHFSRTTISPFRLRVVDVTVEARVYDRRPHGPVLRFRNRRVHDHRHVAHGNTPLRSLPFHPPSFSIPARGPLRK